MEDGEAGHRHYAEVADVGLADGNEFAEEAHCGKLEVLIAGVAEDYDCGDGLEEDGVVSIGLVNGIAAKGGLKAGWLKAGL